MDTIRDLDISNLLFALTMLSDLHTAIKIGRICSHAKYKHPGSRNNNCSSALLSICAVFQNFPRGTVLNSVVMGKEKKVRAHQSLTQQLLEPDQPRKTQRMKSKGKARREEEEFVEGRLSRKILEQARQQQDELEEQYGVGQGSRASGAIKKRKRAAGGTASGRTSLDPLHLRGSDEDSSSDEELDAEVGDDFCPVMTEEDEKAMKLFMNPDKQPRRTLADFIQEKIKDKQMEIATQTSEAPSLSHQMDEKVVAVFNGVGKILSKYRSGKLPKAFKVIPSLCNWEEVLYHTEPDKWSAAAMFQATRIFSSNLSVAKAQRFYNLILLPRIRDDISEYKRLNFHLYMSLKKSLFKPAAFFKGILLPLCESGTCSLREALIISSILGKTSIPMLHSSAALLKIAEMEYSGANSIFLRTLLDKKYALPYRVIDAVVFHFLRFASDPRKLPVLWHQSLLTFVQRYKEDLAVEQKEALLEVIRSKSHHEITPEIRREIMNSKCRDLGEIFAYRQHGSTPMQTQ